MQARPIRPSFARPGLGLVLLVAGMVACTSEVSPAKEQPPAARPESLLAALTFLEGSWRGCAPDGSTFFEEYVLESATILRSYRFADGACGELVDSSAFAVEDGRLVWRWGEFVWVAGRVDEGFAVFEREEAPSSFSWRRISSERVEIVQRWTDPATGKLESAVAELERLRDSQ